LSFFCCWHSFCALLLGSFLLWSRSGFLINSPVSDITKCHYMLDFEVFNFVELSLFLIYVLCSSKP
jgi:hypothetical protein